MSFYTIFKPNDFIYHFRDPQGTCFTIIKGSKHSLLVDSGYGFENVKELVESYIDTPYTVVASHGHMDHISGFYQFDEVQIPSKDVSLFNEHFSTFWRQRNVDDALNRGIIPSSYDTEAYINAKKPKIITFEPGKIFDLGDLHVKVISMEGHTKGSVGFLVMEKRFLLSGDGAIHMIWLFLKESTDKETYIKMLERLKDEPFDNFITGHLMKVYDKSYIDAYLSAAKHATRENSIKTEFHNFERPNCYQYSEKYNEDTVGICYQEPKTEA